jgi:dethiobiotin synthetase
MGRKNPLIVVAATGTEVGKTHVAVALLHAWGQGRAVIGYKPVETGVRGTRDRKGEDALRLERASTFHVKHVFRQTYDDPVSPHLAARRERRPIDLGRIAEQARALAQMADGVVLELAGGLFTPLAPSVVNADLVRELRPTRVLLVAPDRLGVLHDVGATLRAATRMGLRLSGVVLSAPRVPDPSTGTNPRELERALGVRPLAVFPRAVQVARETREAANELVEHIDLLRDGG